MIRNAERAHRMAAAECGAAGDVQQQSYPIDRTFSRVPGHTVRPRAQSRLVRAGESGAPVSSSRDNTWTGHNRHVFVSCGLCAVECAVGVAVAGARRTCDRYLAVRLNYLAVRAYETGFSLRTVSRV